MQPLACLGTQMKEAHSSHRKERLCTWPCFFYLIYTPQKSSESSEHHVLAPYFFGFKLQVSRPLSKPLHLRNEGGKVDDYRRFFESFQMYLFFPSRSSNQRSMKSLTVSVVFVCQNQSPKSERGKPSKSWERKKWSKTHLLSHFSH